MAMFRCPKCNCHIKIRNAYKYTQNTYSNCKKCNVVFYLIGEKNERKKISLNRKTAEKLNLNKFEIEFEKKFNASIKGKSEIQRYDKAKAVVGATATGAVAAAGTTATVAAVGSASTGTAIASLSGAAATKATLAWLGGGALAAGGGGVAMGVAVLTGGAAVVGIGTYKLIRKKTLKK